MRLKKSVILLIVMFCTFLTSCSHGSEDKYPVENQEDLSKLIKKSEEINYPKSSNGKKAEVISNIRTYEKILTLTFEGLPDKEVMEKLLNELDKFNIKATFFVSAIKVAEDTEVAKMAIERGHEISNSTLSGKNLIKTNYKEKVKEIFKGREVIKEKVEEDPKYLRTAYGEVNEDILLAAFQCGYKYVINYNINAEDLKTNDCNKIVNGILKNKKRGSIINFHADKNVNLAECVNIMCNKIEKSGYEFVPMDDFISINEKFKSTEYVLKNDVAINENYKNAQYKIIKSGTTNRKNVALTFDDWGSEDTINSLLDILDKYNVKATFFLRANGVEKNPNLALAIAERGHEIGNHSYLHGDFNKMTPRETQEDIVKAHNIISKAINKEPKRYIRPPRGIMNSKTNKAIAACGYNYIIMYGPDPNDWDSKNTADNIINYCENNVYNGSIFLLHMLDNKNTASALPKIIENILSKGYKFSTISEMIDDN